jgi:hypothetical protein
VLALTETADATKPYGVAISVAPPASAGCSRLHVSGAGAKLAVLPGRGLDPPLMSLARTFTARAKACACRRHLLIPCEAGSGAAFAQAAKISAAAKSSPQTERGTG